jgi:transcriptional regulator NrdR family protein
MVCECGEKMKCTDSRQRNDRTIWRRHQCTCGESFATIETREVEKSMAGRGRKLKIKTSATDIELKRVAQLLNDAMIKLNALVVNGSTLS